MITDIRQERKKQDQKREQKANFKAMNGLLHHLNAHAGGMAQCDQPIPYRDEILAMMEPLIAKVEQSLRVQRQALRAPPANIDAGSQYFEKVADKLPKIPLQEDVNKAKKGDIINMGGIPMKVIAAGTIVPVKESDRDQKGDQEDGVSSDKEETESVRSVDDTVVVSKEDLEPKEDSKVSPKKASVSLNIQRADSKKEPVAPKPTETPPSVAQPQPPQQTKDITAMMTQMMGALLPLLTKLSQATQTAPGRGN